MPKEPDAGLVWIFVRSCHVVFVPWLRFRYPGAKAKCSAASLPHSIVPMFSTPFVLDISFDFSTMASNTSRESYMR